MNILPYEDVDLKTKLSASEVLKKLRRIVDTKRNFSFSLLGLGVSKPYVGTISDDTFTVTRIISYRNSFRPEVRGTIEKSGKGSVIHLKLRMPALTASLMAFVGIFVATVAFGFCVLFVMQIAQYFMGFVLGYMLFLLFFVTFIAGLSRIGFWPEATRAKNDLATLFEAKL